MSEVKFAGQVALVTGASRGIGAAIAPNWWPGA
jgi:NAD(P)-dependent dehydrogenase (short-subunit alcohol dehydrogenase family)